VPSKRAWRREMKRMSFEHEEYSVDPYGALTSRFVSKRGYSTVLVTVGERSWDHSAATVIGMLAHEAEHVRQFIKIGMSDDEPWSKECEAYVLGWAFEGLLAGFEATRGRLTARDKDRKWIRTK
jgi:hypothetical protein